MELNLEKFYRILAPRPVVLVSTHDEKGVSNAAPFSFVMPASTEPPLVAFTSEPSHHTAENILKTGDFVVNIPGYGVLEKLRICSEDFPRGVSEIEKANLSEEKSLKISSPKIKECFAHLECKLENSYTAGDHLLIVGRVVHADIDDRFFGDKGYGIALANPLMHIGGAEFGLLGKIVKA